MNVTAHEPVNGRDVPERSSAALRKAACEVGELGDGSAQATTAEARSANDVMGERMRTLQEVT